MTDVLVVDDSATERRVTGGLLAKAPGVSVRYAVDGQDALRQMEERLPELVLTDLQMPNLSGLELVVEVRRRFPLVPVVVLTSQGSEEAAVAALQRGAACYLSKSRQSDELLETIDTVLSATRANRHQGRLMDCLAETRWKYSLDNDIALIPPLVDQLRQDLARMQLCDETGLTRVGIAVHEALVNAVQHGNLEMKSELRESDECKYQALIEQRRREQPFSGRRVHVDVSVTHDEARIIIRDEGPGFDPSTLPDPTDPCNLERVYGRGLLLVRTFMEEVRHNSTGNQITMVKRRES
ncbi:MAG: response regulator [Planctomycetes bacterium]|nr:response regulator [Planctomycetota bacterium]